VNEVNTIAGFTVCSRYPKLGEASGVVGDRTWDLPG
jgi:D-alanine-D-alanine ligase-like ATP-grasp enzyme